MKSQMTKKTSVWWRLAVTTFTLTLLQGCAVAPGGNPADPLESFNRKVYSFNDGLDRTVVRPVASAYRDITPKPIRTGVTNFFANIADVWSTVNNVLQFKPEAATDSLFRVTVNTLWGLGGLIDVASEMKIPKHSEDFGQTLGRWGVGAGPYLVLPVLGSSTVRDALGTTVDIQGNLLTRSKNIAFRNTVLGVGIVNVRANLLDAGDLLEQAALDKYSFSRDVYLQRRRSLVGRPTAEVEERFDLPEVAADVLTPSASLATEPAN